MPAICGMRCCSATQPRTSTSSERYGSSPCPSWTRKRCCSAPSTARAKSGPKTSCAEPATKVSGTACELTTALCIQSRAVFDRLKRIAPFLKPLLILIIFAIALRVLGNTLAHYRYHDIVSYISSLPIDQIVAAVVLTLLGYL